LILEAVIVAVVAGVVLYQLYAVLGRRVGRQPEDVAPQPAMPRVGDLTKLDTDAAPQPAGVSAIRARDPSFEADTFLQGAKTAYEVIVCAFATGDRPTLKKLVSAHVMDGFEKAMKTREDEGRSESIEFSQPPRADLETLDADGDTARAKVRFLAEFRSRSKGPEGEAVDDRRTAEVWTFERKLSNRDPNWTLVRVDAAEA
jgi:predicted lipid-binding transport protein (Tim44 family)